MANPLVKRLLFGLHKASVATEIKFPFVINTAMTPSERLQSLPAIGLVGQESNFKVIGSNVCDGMILHAPLRSVGVGLPTVSTE